MVKVGSSESRHRFFLVTFTNHCIIFFLEKKTDRLDARTHWNYRDMVCTIKQCTNNSCQNLTILNNAHILYAMMIITWAATMKQMLRWTQKQSWLNSAIDCLLPHDDAVTSSISQIRILCIRIFNDFLYSPVRSCLWHNPSLLKEIHFHMIFR